MTGNRRCQRIHDLPEALAVRMILANANAFGFQLLTRPKKRCSRIPQLDYRPRNIVLTKRLLVSGTQKYSFDSPMYQRLPDTPFAL